MSRDSDRSILDDLLDMVSEDLSDEAYELLADASTRHVLYYMLEEQSVTLSELADVVAGLQATDEDTIVSPGDRDRVKARLYHVVLPKLDAAGYVRFDPADQTVTRADVPPAVVDLLESGDEEPDECDESVDGDGNEHGPNG